MTFMDIFPWVVSAFSIIGVVLNIKKMRICFYIWLFTNASWTIVDFVFGLYAQSLLFLVYTGLAVYGIIEWKKEK
jgi:nicotinamide riboside transporter PnuC